MRVSPCLLAALLALSGCTINLPTNLLSNLQTAAKGASPSPAASNAPPPDVKPDQPGAKPDQPPPAAGGHPHHRPPQARPRPGPQAARGAACRRHPDPPSAAPAAAGR